MKKIHMIAALLAMLLPTVVFANTGGSTTYYAALKAQVSSNSSGMGKVYAGTSTSAPSASSYNATSSTSGNQSSTTKDDTSKKGYAFAQANEGYEFVGWSTSNNGSSTSTASPYTVNLTCSSTSESSPTLTTVYANFKKKVLAAFSITFETSDNGTYTVDGAAPANKTGLTEATSVKLASSDERFLNWVINGTEATANPHTVSCTANTTISAVFLTADMVASVTTLSDLTAALSNAQYKKITIPSGTTIQIPKGTTVTVPSGKQLVMDGTLNVLGTLSNSGTISGNGTLYKVSQLITQGDVKTLYNVKGEALGNVALRSNTGKPAKYRATTVASNNPTVSGTTPGCTVSWGAMLNGGTVYAITAQTPKALKVTLKTTACVNEITAVTGTITGDIDVNGDYLLIQNCNLTGPIVVESSKYNRLRFSGTIDLAGKKLTATSYQMSSSFTGLFVNGSIEFCSSSNYLQQGHAAFFNCSSVALKGIKNGGATFYFYDCGSSGSPATISYTYYSTTRTTDYRNAYYYCGVYSYTFSSGNDTDMSHVYAGSYSSDPTAYLYNVDEVEAVYNQTTKYYDVREKREPTYVCVIGTTQYESLTEAVTAAGNGAKIALTAAIDLTGTTLTVPSTKNITISLDKHTVTGGKIVNNGTLTLVDLTDANQGTLGSDIENNGTIDVTYGTYSGNILLNSGTFTTHGGVFTGTISAPSGVDLKEVANLRGGQFSKDPAAALRSDYSAPYWHFQSSDPMYYWVGVFPVPVVSATTYSGTDKAWKMDFLSSTDLALYQKQTDRSEFSSDADWRRRAELESSIYPYHNYIFDCALLFDRDVSSGSVTFAGKTQVGVSESLDKDVSANTYYPVLAKRIFAQGYTPYTFKRTILEVKSATAGVKNNSTANNGVVCMIESQLCTQDGSVVGKFNKLYALSQVRYMLGGKKAAIDRGASRLAYDSLAAAVSAVQDGERVLVGADTAENVTLPNAAGEYIIDPYGFAFTGTVTAPEGLTVTSEEVASLASAQGVESAKAVKYTVAVPPSIATVDGADLASWDAVVAAVAEASGSVAVVVTAPLTESLALAAGKTLTVSVADGVSATVTVTPAADAFLETSAVDGTTTYVSKKITVTMAEPQASVEVTKIENGEESEVTGAEAEAAVATLVGNGDVPRTDNTDKLDVLDLVTVTPTKIVEEVAGGKTTIRSATFDVTPNLKVASLGEGQKLKFRLPVDAAATQIGASVYHDGVLFGFYPVQTENEEKFIEVASADFSPYGYTLLDGETESPVAIIGTTGYVSLAEAVATATAGDTITLVADDTVSLTNGQEIEIDKPLTITGAVDENGDPLYTIYGTPNQTGFNDIFVASSSGTVTISNLAIAEFGSEKENSTNGHAPIVVSSGNNSVVLDNLVISDFNRTGIKINGGEFLVKDCLIDCSTDLTNYRIGGVDIANAATGAIVGTTITDAGTSDPTTWVSAALELIGSGAIRVEDCEFADCINGIFVSTADGTSPGSSAVTVINTTVEADMYALSNDSDAEGAVIAVQSGMFAGLLDASEDTGLSISGGQFDGEVPEEYCADGYIPTPRDPVTGKYTVKQGTFVAAVYDDSFELVGKYETLYDAVRAAQDGYTVELLADVEESVTIGKSIALAGECTITGTTKVTDGATVTMEDVSLDGNGTIYALDIAGGATVEMSGVTVGGGVWCNVHVNGGTLRGEGVTMQGDELVVAADGQTFTYNGETLDAAEAPWGLDVKQIPGKTLKVPFMDIVRESGTDVVELDDTQDKPLVQAGSILYVANMPGDTTLTDVTLPERFGSYSLTIDAGIAFLGDADTPTTGWTVGDWNGVVDTGSTVLDAIGEDSGEVPVELTLNGDTDLGENVFEFRYSNLTIDGGDHAVSGTIKYTDDAGVIKNIVLGTDGKPLTLDMTEVTDTIHLGNGVNVANVVIQLTAEQATAGTPVFKWTPGEGAAPEHEDVVIQVAGSASDSELVWDNELGVAYIGPCEARLTGPTHDEPIYTSLAHAIELAANSGDTVTLLTDIEDFTGTQNIGKSLTLDGDGHTITAGAGADGEEMFNVTGNGDVTFTDITVDGAHKYTYCIQVFGEADLTLQDVTVLHGTKEWFSGFKYGAGVHVNGGTLEVAGDFTAFSGGKTDESFPFTGILYEGGSIHFADGATASIANPADPTDTDLLLVGMLGALDVSDPEDKAQVEAMLATMNVPAGFYPYTLKINPDEWNNGFEQNTSFTGASPLGWNDIIDYGKAIMEAISMDTDETPVEVGLLTDTILPDTFTFEDSNFTVNGNGYALSGTIEYTDNAGLIKNIVLGTDDNELVLDMTGVTEPIEFGSGVVVENVVIKLTEDQATAGTPVIIWDVDGGVDAPEHEEGVTVQLVDDQGEPTGETAELIWDEDWGMAYIGPVEARLTGPTHDKPIYTTLADAIERAAQSGDTVTLLMDIANFENEILIDKSLTLDGDGHTITAGAGADGEEMFNVTGNGDVTFTDITLDGAHKFTYCIQVYGSAQLTLEDVTVLHGTKEWFSGFKYGAGVHVNGGSLVVDGDFTAFSGGKTDESFPFTGILYEGGSIHFANGATASIANPADPTDTDLLLVGMLGALDVSDPDDKAQVEAMLATMNVPTGFYPYTLKINPDEWNSGFEQNTSFTGASPLGWNAIIDYGKAIMEAISMDTDETPVEVGLLTDTELPDTFTYRDANFSVNGNGYALSGTIVFTDDAEGGKLANIELGTDGKTLVLDLSQTANAVNFGAGVTITDITVKMTEDQARVGTVVFDWDTEEVTGDDLPQHGTVSVTVVDDQGVATGVTKGLVWDEEYGVAYIGPVEARLSGATHTTPIYTTLADALARAVDGDTVKLLANAVLTDSQNLEADATLDLSGYAVEVKGAAGIVVVGATLDIVNTDESVMGGMSAGEGAAPTSLLAAGEGGLVRIPTGIFAGSGDGAVLATSGSGAFEVSGGYFSVAVLSAYCATGYAPADAETGAPQPYTVAETILQFVYPIEGTAGVLVSNEWLAAQFPSIYPDATAPILASITNALVTALSENGANGMPRWESYVLGLDPKSADAVLRLTAAPVAADGTQVAISAVIDKTKFPVLANVAVTFRLAEQNGEEWTDVDGCTGSDEPSFARPLEGVVGKVLRIFADIEVR